MPTSDLSYDAYRFHRSIDMDPLVAVRPTKNVAKVEPYSIHSANNRLEPPPTKARIFLNSMGTSSAHSSSSTSSLSGMTRHSNVVLQSDFLVPHRAYSPRFVAPPPPPTAPSSAGPMLFLPGSPRLTNADLSLANGHTSRALLSTMNSSAKSRSLTPRDFPILYSVSTASHCCFSPIDRVEWTPCSNGSFFASFRFRHRLSTRRSSR